MGAFTWVIIGKEEMPEFESNWVRINTFYPGAPAEDVELFVTRPIEEELKGVVGIDEVITTSSLGVSSVRIIMDDDYPDKDEVLQDIQEASLRVKLPSEVRELPRIRQFKSSEKAILDVGVYIRGVKKLDVKSRQKLQQFILSFENQLLARKEISAIDRSHYLKPELQVIIDPKIILEKDISLSQVMSQIKANNIRLPIGSLMDKGESRVTALSELDNVQSLKSLVLQGNYEGHGDQLQDITHSIRDGFEKSNSIFKVNGHEAIFLNIKKSISTDILTAQKAVSSFIDKFKKINPSIEIIQMDDESYAVRNRLNIISTNGVIGFLLIVLVLLIFLDLKTGFWVAMGIPFSMGVTIIISYLIGYTVNNMTLAGIIIVLGIVVDDAIIIAENISRHKEKGGDLLEACIVGTTEVIRPIFASIITTCVAFVPLMFFEGFFGKLVTYIPVIVILMLFGSLLESTLVLPTHLASESGQLDKLSKTTHQHWFYRYEKIYARFLKKVFQHRIFVLVGFMGILAIGATIFMTKMKFVMFPREESKEVFIKIKAPKDSTRIETSMLISDLEEYLSQDIKNVVGVRSSVGLSRRGGEVRENEASILVEILPRDERSTNLNELITKWEKFSEKLSGLDSIKFLRGRWGHGSGSAIELQIQENDEQRRGIIARELLKEMKTFPELKDVELEAPLVKNEFLLQLNQKNLVRYNVLPSSITNVLRTFVEGSILYSINKGEEEVDVRLTVSEKDKTDLDELKNLRVENREGKLIYLKNVMDIKSVKRPVNITRNNFKRTTMIYANMEVDTMVTPLELAQKMEQGIFTKINRKYPTAILSFKGEIEDTRESQGEFRNSIIIVILLIYLILVIMFNSLTKPFLILSIVPFGMAGVTFVLLAHGMNIYGFFAVIGAIGMIGVVINDAIVMLDKIEKSLNNANIDSKLNPWDTISKVAATRLRPVLLTTITTVVGILPTAYGLAGYDSMLAEMMLTMGWGLAFGTIITLILIPVLYSIQLRKFEKV